MKETLMDSGNIFPNNISFILNENFEPVEVIRISKDGFFYKGQRVDDIHNVYERFNEWLIQAELNNNKNSK